MVFIIYYEIKTVKLNKVNKYKYIINIFYHYIQYRYQRFSIFFLCVSLGYIINQYSVSPLPLMTKNRTIQTLQLNFQ